MVLPRGLARFNRIATNRVLGPLAGHLASLAVIRHRGRRSGRMYETPVSVFRKPGGYLIALTYGPDTDWVRNVLAAGGCDLKLGGRWIRLDQPSVVHDEQRAGVPPMVRRALAVPGVTDFLHLREAAN
jgi:deazaflavin-dependent oxidoreductase (nitroreductase family)